ncbi:MAG: preprotein translocase subunit SecE [Candidatus Izimaplasma sp.]|nr:preprotein translocase subunit SecE [Candidatus Izimaplasma bacterium]
MAKKTEEIKKNKVLEILKKEYPFEKILLGVLGAIVVILGIYLVEGTVLEIRYTDWWIFNSPLKVTIFSIFVIVIGVISFLLSIWPFFVPSFGEMKKVSWPNKVVISNHSARVFGFIFVIGMFFVAIDLGLMPLFEWLNGLGA